jgi:hypothetical protein
MWTFEPWCSWIIQYVYCRFPSSSLRSRSLVRAGEERASFEETPAQMAVTNLFSPIKDDWRFVISTFTHYPIIVEIYI